MDCSVTGCIKHEFCGGKCHKHYDIDRVNKLPRCSVDECNSAQHAKGLCNKHYRIEIKKEKPDCIIDGCGRKQNAEGLCNSHYMRKNRNGHLDTKRSKDWGAKGNHPLYHNYKWMIRKQGKISIDKSWTDDFWCFVKDMGDKPEPRVTLSRKIMSKPFNKENCYWKLPVLEPIQAKTHKEYQRKYIKRLREEKPAKFAEYDFKRHYGITLCQYNDMFSKQNGKCLICDNEEKAKHPVSNMKRRLAVDHCHDTGIVRGLLCTNCNLALGGFMDSPAILEEAIKYLENHSLNYRSLKDAS